MVSMVGIGISILGILIFVGLPIVVLMLLFSRKKHAFAALFGLGRNCSAANVPVSWLYKFS